MTGGSRSPDHELFEWNYLPFRSQSEIRIAEVLDRLRVAFFPNAKGRFYRDQGAVNRCPDFLVPFDGKLGVLEVDGPHHKRADDDERDALLRANGIHTIVRASADDCYTTPELVVREFLNKLDPTRWQVIRDSPSLSEDQLDSALADGEDNCGLESLPTEFRVRMAALDCAVKWVSVNPTLKQAVTPEYVLQLAQEFADYMAS